MQKNTLIETKKTYDNSTTFIWYEEMLDTLTIVMTDTDYCEDEIIEDTISLLFDMDNDEVVGIGISNIYNKYADYMNVNENNDKTNLSVFLTNIRESHPIPNEHKKFLNDLILKSNNIDMPNEIDSVYTIHDSSEDTKLTTKNYSQHVAKVENLFPLYSRIAVSVACVSIVGMSMTILKHNSNTAKSQPYTNQIKKDYIHI